MRPFIIILSALIFAFSLSSCTEGEHGHEHGKDSDHGHNTPDHHNSIK